MKDELTGFKLLDDFRALVRRGVEMALAQYEYGKPYEGTLEYRVYLPPTTSEDETPGHRLDLHCYVLGPYRHYRWIGNTAADVFGQATAEVNEWIRLLEEP